MKKVLAAGIVLVFLSLGSCSKDGSGFNLFTIEQDKQFGIQMDSTILSDPQQFPIISRHQYASAYAYIDSMKNVILNSGEIRYKEEFAWDIKLIQNDTVYNAFATPGGYIYIYTGLIRFLESENELAGVLGHEMAHADRRHSTNQLTKNYGISILLDIVLGIDRSQITHILAGLISLQFSQKDEADADEHSVIYLCPTNYKADGAAGFFEKLVEQSNGSRTPQFLSTHPDPGNRVLAIKAKKQELSCIGNETLDERYNSFKTSLPQ